MPSERAHAMTAMTAMNKNLTLKMELHHVP
jgi:hypothetical protein